MKKKVEMSRLAQLFFLCIVCICVSSGCFNRTQVLSHDFKTPDFVNDWSQGDCDLPCWYGIQPGKTTLDEAIAILNTIPEINYVETVPEGFVRFDVTGGGYRNIAGLLTYDVDNELIEEIQYFAGDSISLREIINVTGEPSHFTASATNGVYEIKMLFPENGVQLGWDGLLDSDELLLLSPDQQNLLIKFVDPNTTQEILLDSGEIWQEWPGFVLLELNCSSEPCQLTPQIP